MAGVDFTLLILMPYTDQAVFFTHHVLQVDERVIDGHNLHLLGGESSTGHQTTDAAESEKWTVLCLIVASRWWYNTV